jgi:hypothetical protein
MLKRIDNVNLIQIYFASDPSSIEKNTVVRNAEACYKLLRDIDVKTDGVEELESLKMRHRPGKKQKTGERYIIFYNKSLKYVYHIQTDNQFVFKHELEYVEFLDFQDKKLIINYIRETKLPCHKFPCSNTYDKKEKINAVEHKINNRLSWITRKDEDTGDSNDMIEYKYSESSDLEKTNNALEKLLNQIRLS